MWRKSVGLWLRAGVSLWDRREPASKGQTSCGYENPEAIGTKVGYLNVQSMWKGSRGRDTPSEHVAGTDMPAFQHGTVPVGPTALRGQTNTACCLGPGREAVLCSLLGLSLAEL